MCSNRTLSRALFACVFFVSLTSGLRAQDAVIPGAWPSGWGGCGALPSADALQILYVPLSPICQITDAALRLTIGPGYNSPIFGQLGVVDSLHDPYFHPTPAEWFSAFAPINATVLRSSEGDLVLSATTFNNTPTHGPLPLTASIRFGTTPDTLSGTTEHPAEIERAEILGNGNFGLDIPMDLVTRLCKPLDQFQLGGAVLPYPGNPFPTPGLTFYGGSSLENTPHPGGGLYPGDWRYIAFNSYVDHTDTSANRSHRFSPVSSSEIAFSDNDNTHDGGMIDLHCMPFDTARGLDDFRRGINFHLMGSKGLEMWCDVSDADPYHHLFDVLRPGYDGGAGLRNVNGLFYHHTPVYIGGSETPDFTRLANVRPNLGDDSTWDLAVNGPALFKEAWVNSSDWPDFVFQPNYKLPSLQSVEKYIATNHHLPDVPSAEEITSSGIQLGKTDEIMMKKIEELTEYVINDDKKIETLTKKVEELENQKGR
jgi:hypothetical protein